MIRGRLTGIGGEAVEPADYADPRAQRLAEREFNLSFARTRRRTTRSSPAPGGAADDPSPQFSVEEGHRRDPRHRARRRAALLGRRREVAAPVTSLRRVQWDSFNVNFFVIGTPGLLREEPATYVTSFYLPASREALVPELLRAFPSVTLIDVGTLLARCAASSSRASAPWSTCSCSRSPRGLW
jgi:putative ABC transport system permease protein